MEDVTESINVNILGSLRCIKGVLPTMRAQKSGTIVNHGSVLGISSTLGVGAYSWCKFALEAMTETLRVELVGMCIRSWHSLASKFVRGSVCTAGYE